MSLRVLKQQTPGLAAACSPFKLPEMGEQPLSQAAEKYYAARPAAAAPALQPKPGPKSAPSTNAHAGPEQADEMIQAARREAEQLLAEAQAGVVTLEREARERGQSEAQAQATIELERAVEDLRQEFTQSLRQLDTLRATMAAQAERDLVKLAIEMAKKIVQREVTVDHEVALTLARVALARLHNRAVAKVRLHPDDYQSVSARREQTGADGSIEFIEDRLVGRGGCLIETEMGDIDARIEQQFAEIERNFLSG